MIPVAWSSFGNSYLDISTHFGQVALAIRSQEGDGLVTLGANPLQVGSNNLSTDIAGVIEGSGLLVKIGTGTLALSGQNTYTGGPLVSKGSLVLNDSTGSGTGAGTVAAQAGTLGGSGAIAGAVTVGTGHGPGAFLAPSAGSKGRSP